MKCIAISLSFARDNPACGGHKTFKAGHSWDKNGLKSRLFLFLILKFINLYTYCAVLPQIRNIESRIPSDIKSG